MTWLLRSAPISFRARRLRTAWAAGIICELGKRAAVTTACRSMRSSKGRSRKRPAKRGTEGTGGQLQGGTRGGVGDLRLHSSRAFVIGAAGKTREALLTEQDGEGVDADGMAGGSQFADD